MNQENEKYLANQNINTQNLNTKKLFVSACEPSANVHLKALSRYLDQNLRICGVFDQQSLSNFTNAQSSYSLKDFAVMGFFDILKKIFFFKKAIREMAELAMECDVALLMDSSSFNLPIAQYLKKHNASTKVVYYILPQVWAWKPWRAKKIESICDYLCAILPFELQSYPNALREGRISYVGHPLLDEIPSFKHSLKDTLPLQDKNKKNQKEIIAFMPGSRKNEIKHIFPIFAQVAKSLPKDLTRILVIPEHFGNLDSQSLMQIYGEEIKDFELSFDANESLLRAKFAFICSGTATLQATLIGTPIVLGYKTCGIDVAIYRMFIKLNFIGLANIFYNAIYTGSPKSGTYQIHKELIQKDLNVENLLNAYRQTSPEDFLQKAQEIRDYLKNGSAQKMIQILNNMLESNTSTNQNAENQKYHNANFKS